MSQRTLSQRLFDPKGFVPLPRRMLARNTTESEIREGLQSSRMPTSPPPIRIVATETKSSKIYQNYIDTPSQVTQEIFLPPEVLAYLFQFIPYEDWYSILCTCRPWMTVGRTIFDPSRERNWPLRRCCQKGQLQAVKYLMSDSRVDPNCRGEYGGCTAIQIAAAWGHAEIVAELLKDPRTQPHEDDNYAIKWANKGGHRHVVQMLKQSPLVREFLGSEEIPLPQVRPNVNLETIGWFGTITREHAESLLANSSPGEFLLRWSHNVKCYVISYKAPDVTVRHISGIVPGQNNTVLVVGTREAKESTFPDICSCLESFKRVGKLSNPISLPDDSDYKRTLSTFPN